MVTDFQRKQKRKSFKYLLIVGGIFIAIVFILLLIADIRVYQKRAELNSRIENLKNKIQDIKDKNNNLQEGIAKADDNNYIEKIAREELGLQKEGEKVFSFIIPQEQNLKNEEASRNFFQVWLGWLTYFWRNRF